MIVVLQTVVVVTWRHCEGVKSDSFNLAPDKVKDDQKKGRKDKERYESIL